MTRTVELKNELSFVIDYPGYTITMNKQEYVDGDNEGERHHIGQPTSRGASPGDLAAVERFAPELLDVVKAVWSVAGIEMNEPPKKHKK